METNSELIGKQVKLFFDDGQKVNCYVGIIKEFSNSHVVFLSDGKENIIPLVRVIRMEVMK